eukprot:5283456-Alexandrium_andersonii.AAC.1
MPCPRRLPQAKQGKANCFSVSSALMQVLPPLDLAIGELPRKLFARARNCLLQPAIPNAPHAVDGGEIREQMGALWHRVPICAHPCRCDGQAMPSNDSGNFRQGKHVAVRWLLYHYPDTPAKED